MLIALISMNPIWENKEANMRVCEVKVEEAKYLGADIIIFPEMTLTGFSVKNASLSESLADSKTLSFFSKVANKYKLNIVFGFALILNGGNYNVAVCVNRDGKLLGEYSKTHTFSHAEEHLYFKNGTAIKSVQIEGVNFGLSICYDLRFPEIFSNLSNESKIIINIANWPAQRINHWDTLLRARAIENQCCVIGVNRSGTDGLGIDYMKSSKIIMPDGVNLEPISVNMDIDLYKLEIDIIERYRNTFDTRSDRRPSFYLDLFRDYEGNRK